MSPNCSFMNIFLDKNIKMEVVVPILVVIIVVIVTVFFYLIYKQFEDIKGSLNEIKSTIQNEINKIDIKFTNTVSRSNQLHADTLKKMIIMQSLNTNKKNIKINGNPVNENNDKNQNLYMGSDNESERIDTKQQSLDMKSALSDEHIPIYGNDDTQLTNILDKNNEIQKKQANEINRDTNNGEVVYCSK